MLLRTLIFALVFHVANLVLLWLWLPYADFWAQFAYAAAGINAIPWTTWATTAEWWRFALVAGLAIGAAWLTGRWADQQDAVAAATAADEDVDGAHATDVRWALDALGNTRWRQRLEILEAFAHKLQNGLTTDDAVALLGALRHAERVRGVKMLAHRLAPTAEIGRLASGTTDAERAEIVKALT